MSIKKSTEKPPYRRVQWENIPQELKNISRWAMWAWTWREKGSKWDKPPLQTNGNAAANNNPKHWGEFAKAKEAAADKNRFSGVGFTLGDKGCGYTVIDLDNCLDEFGLLEPWAEEIIRYMDSYTEVSPSGEGVKIWVRGQIPEGEWASRAGNLEVYDHGRYLTVTGQVLSGREVMTEGGAKLERFLVDNMLRGELADKTRPDDMEWAVECTELALEAIDPDCDYDTWVRVGMAIHWLDPKLFDLWDEWSAEGGKYEGSDACKAKWDSFGGNNANLTLGTLFYIAQQNGWVMPTKGYEESDWGVARRVVDVLAGRAMYIQEWKKWVTWTGRSFATGPAQEVSEAIVKVSKQMMSEAPEDDGTKEAAKEIKAWYAMCMSYQSAVKISLVRGLTEGFSSCSFTELDRRTDLFHCDNVTLHLDNESGKVAILPHDPSYRNTQLSKVVHSPTATCPTWQRFIAEITGGSEALADYLQRIVGFCLTGRTDDQSLYILYGDGNNGKGAFCRTILKMLGSYGAAINQSLLMETRHKEHQTQFATLYGKRCVVTQETDQGCKLNESQVKSLTGSDLINCRRMREDEWQFEPTHKVMLATNNLPIIRGTDNGIWRRVKLIPFTAKVTPDPKLEPAMLGELPGILNWALEGFRKVVQEGGFPMPKEVEVAKAEYRSDMDIIGQFVEDRCDLDPSLQTKNEDLFAALKQYCEAQGQFVPSIKRMTADLARLGVKNKRMNSYRYKLGIGLRQISLDDEFD
jgi:putative DNA primase/helicase